MMAERSTRDWLRLATTGPLQSRYRKYRVTLMLLVALMLCKITADLPQVLLCSQCCDWLAPFGLVLFACMLLVVDLEIKLALVVRLLDAATTSDNTTR